MIEILKGKVVPQKVEEGQDTFSQIYNPDVLLCLANLSNDEVFTPPEVANQMLDMLPQELFEDPNTKFLDPACKSGVFLREIAKRLIKGLEATIPELEERIDHICKEQLYGIAITELTSLLSRRSVYCSKYPNGPFSIAHFDNVEGNIRFKNCKHEWEGHHNTWTFEKGEKVRVWRRCKWCGASEEQFGDENRQNLEAHAYEFIHVLKPEEIFNMKFDVIISNPPYQLSDGGSKASAKPIYQLFVQKAKQLNPRYMTMVIPARWFSGGKGLDDFRSEMLHDSSITELVDYFDSAEVFPGVDISGGICYFLWDRDNHGDCRIVSCREGKQSIMTRSLLEDGDDTFIRFNEAVNIIRKVKGLKEPLFYEEISSRKPFGLDTKTKIYNNKKPGMVKIFAYPDNGFIEKSKVQAHKEWIDKIKVCVSYAYGERGSFPYFVIGKPFIAPSGSCCTETYLVVRTVESNVEAQNIISYMTTKFFRFLVLLKKNTQHATKTVYGYVPMQDFSKPWTDSELYKKYTLNDDEIAFIESMIRPME